MLILDEPLTGLDAAVSRQVKDLLQERVRGGATVILTTHILEVAERMADRIGIIQNGRLLAEGTLDELRERAGEREGTLEDVFLELTGELPATGEDRGGARVIGRARLDALAAEPRDAPGLARPVRRPARRCGASSRWPSSACVFLVGRLAAGLALRGLDPPVNPLTILVADVACDDDLHADAVADAGRRHRRPLRARRPRPAVLLAARSAQDADGALRRRWRPPPSPPSPCWRCRSWSPMAIFGHWRWLALLPVLAALALAASGGRAWRWRSASSP